MYFERKKNVFLLLNVTLNVMLKYNSLLKISVPSRVTWCSLPIAVQLVYSRRYTNLFNEQPHCKHSSEKNREV